MNKNNPGRRTRERRLLLSFLLACTCVSLPIKASAQQGAPAPPPANAPTLGAATSGQIQTFQPAYFSGNQPATAADMVALLPGFRLQNGDTGLRGYSGAVPNILIDGQLPTSKDVTSSDLLARIPAGAVDHIELIRGAGDMHGYSILANVVRKRTVARITGRVQVQGGVTHYGTSEQRILVSFVRQSGDTTLEVGGSYGRDIGSQNQNGFGSRRRYTPSGTPVFTSTYNYPRLTNIADATINYRTPLLGGNLVAGGNYRRQRPHSDIVENITFPAILVATGLENTLTESGEGRLDYRHRLGRFGNLQMFGQHRITAQEVSNQTNNGVRIDQSRSNFNTHEDTGRLFWNYTGRVKLEAGVEASLNVMTSKSSLTQGGVPQVLPAANIRLQENRMEQYAVATWRFDSTLGMELGARYETVHLIQTGDSNLVKDFAFFKPRWLTTWNPNSRNEFRFMVQRLAGQLVFRDFAASTSLNTNLVTAGNKNLEPARAWEISAIWQAQILGKGTLVLEARREMISHVVDNVPVFAGARVFTATGNIGYGYRDGINANFIGTMEAIGLPHLTLNLMAEYRRSRVHDPLTGVVRVMNGGQTGNIQVFQFQTQDTITYDFPEQNLRLGMDFHNHGNSQERDFRVDEVDDNNHGFKLGFFAQFKPTPQWTIRVFDRDAFQTSGLRDREVYSGPRNTSPISFLERRLLSNGAVYGLDVQYTF